VTEEPEPYAACVGCLLPVERERYFANDHMCDSCAQRHNDLLDGLIPRLKD
jgi:hypothetical protein